MLNTEPNIAAPDDFYQALVELHRDLTPEQSRLVNAKLILLLANHIGDPAVLSAAMGRARAGIAAAVFDTAPGAETRAEPINNPGRNEP